MVDQLIQIADDFWNLRGTFKLLLFNVGTQMSLARLKSGDFVLLDSYAPPDEIKQEILALTDGGRKIKAILNLHPFHTLHVQAVAALFPQARLFGTRRHVAKAPGLRWESVHTEDPEMGDTFADDFDFSVPRGVDFIPENESLHFASVLAFHRSSKTLHVDDTLSWSTLPILKGLQFHPSLPKVLERRPGAVDDFLAWSDELKFLCQSVEYLCTAHMSTLPPSAREGAQFGELIDAAKRTIQKHLDKHKARFG